MHIHSLKFKKYIGDKGFYGDITLSAEAVNEEKRLEISYNDVNVESEWLTAIEFGVKFFYEHYYKHHGNALKVHVDRLHTMVEDSSYMVVFFVTVKCLCEMVLPSRNLVEIKADGSFSVCK